jgi:prophage regulatory protein
MFYRLKDVIKVLTLSKSTIYRLIKAGLFPEPVPLSPGRVAWRKSDIDEFAQSKNPQQKLRGA